MIIIFTHVVRTFQNLVKQNHQVKIVIASGRTNVDLAEWIIDVLYVYSTFSEGGDLCTYTREVAADFSMQDSTNYTAEYTDTSEYIIHRPSVPPKNTGFIFLRGGQVDATAYSFYGAAMSSSGYIAFNLKLSYVGVGEHCQNPPSPAAINELSTKIDQIILDNSDIANWVITGHSLGTVVLDQYIRGVNLNPKIKGFAYMGGYTGASRFEDVPLPNYLAASLILATQDLRLPWDVAIATADLYPDNTDFICILGGNHGSMGWYGDQEGDGALVNGMTIEQEHDLIIGQLLGLLDFVETGSSGTYIRSKSADLSAEVTACSEWTPPSQ